MQVNVERYKSLAKQYEDNLLNKGPFVNALGSRVNALLENAREDSLEQIGTERNVHMLQDCVNILSAKKEEQTSFLLKTLKSGGLAVFKIVTFILWEIPSYIFRSGYYLLFGSPLKNLSDSLNSDGCISTQQRFFPHQLKRIPIGLRDENPDDCFLNSFRQFIYNTPIAGLLLALFEEGTFPCVVRDYRNYQSQAVGNILGGARNVRAEHLPPGAQEGQQDVHETFMRLFSAIGEAESPFRYRVACVRAYDVLSSNKVHYDHFTHESKGSIYITENHRVGVHRSLDILGPISLSIRPDENSLCFTSLQDVWDHFANPACKRTIPPPSFDEYGAYLNSSAPYVSPWDKGQIVKRDGRTKLLLDQLGEMFRFLEIPKVLIFSLNRYSHRPGSKASKIHNAIAMGKKFTLDDRHSIDGMGAHFQIKSFILHVGEIDSGHYITYVWSNNGWYECDNCHITKVSHAKAIKAMERAYFFYAERLGQVFRASKTSLSPFIQRITTMLEYEKPKSPPYHQDRPRLIGSPLFDHYPKNADALQKKAIDDLESEFWSIIGEANKCERKSHLEVRRTLSVLGDRLSEAYQKIAIYSAGEASQIAAKEACLAITKMQISYEEGAFDRILQINEKILEMGRSVTYEMHRSPFFQPGSPSLSRFDQIISAHHEQPHFFTRIVSAAEDLINTSLDFFTRTSIALSFVIAAEEQKTRASPESISMDELKKIEKEKIMSIALQAEQLLLSQMKREALRLKAFSPTSREGGFFSFHSTTLEDRLISIMSKLVVTAYLNSHCVYVKRYIEAKQIQESQTNPNLPSPTTDLEAAKNRILRETNIQELMHMGLASGFSFLKKSPLFIFCQTIDTVTMLITKNLDPFEEDESLNRFVSYAKTFIHLYAKVGLGAWSFVGNQYF